MAGDSSPEDQAAQGARADKVKFSRQFSRQTGISPAQARRVLTAMSTRVAQPQQGDPAQKTDPPRFHVSPEDLVKVDNAQWNVKGREAEVGAGPGAQQAPGQGNDPGGATADFTVCVDNGDSTFSKMTAHFVNGRLILVD